MDAVLFYRSFYEAIKGLKSSDRVKVYDAVFAYALDGEEPQLSGICKSIFTLIKPQVDANIKRRTDGLKGGRPKKTTGYENEKTTGYENEKPNEKVKVNEKVNEKVNDKESVREKTPRFSPPTLDEVKAYCAERHNHVDPVRFFDFYEAKGWMVGKNKMRDWKAAVRTWEASDKERNKGEMVNRNNSDKLKALEEKFLRRDGE